MIDNFSEMLHKFVFLLMGADFSVALKTDVEIFHCHFIVRSPSLLTFDYRSCWASPLCFLTLDFLCVCPLLILDSPAGSDSRVCLQCSRPGFNPWVGKISWRRKWQPTPVFLHGKSHGRKSLVGYSPWGCKELDMTERLHFHFSFSTCSFFCWAILLKFVVNSLFMRYLSIYALSSEMSYLILLSTLTKNETLSSFLLK